MTSHGARDRRVLERQEKSYDLVAASRVVTGKQEQGLCADDAMGHLQGATSRKNNNAVTSEQDNEEDNNSSSSSSSDNNNNVGGSSSSVSSTDSEQDSKDDAQDASRRRKLDDDDTFVGGLGSRANVVDPDATAVLSSAGPCRPPPSLLSHTDMLSNNTTSDINEQLARVQLSGGSKSRVASHVGRKHRTNEQLEDASSFPSYKLSLSSLEATAVAFQDGMPSSASSTSSAAFSTSSSLSSASSASSPASTWGIPHVNRFGDATATTAHVPPSSSPAQLADRQAPNDHVNPLSVDQAPETTRRQRAFSRVVGSPPFVPAASGTSNGHNAPSLDNALGLVEMTLPSSSRSQSQAAAQSSSSSSSSSVWSPTTPPQPQPQPQTQSQQPHHYDNTPSEPYRSALYDHSLARTEPQLTRDGGHELEGQNDDAETPPSRYVEVSGVALDARENPFLLHDMFKDVGRTRAMFMGHLHSHGTVTLIFDSLLEAQHAHEVINSSARAALDRIAGTATTTSVYSLMAPEHAVGDSINTLSAKLGVVVPTARFVDRDSFKLILGGAGRGAPLSLLSQSEGIVVISFKGSAGPVNVKSLKTHLSTYGPIRSLHTMSTSQPTHEQLNQHPALVVEFVDDRSASKAQREIDGLALGHIVHYAQLAPELAREIGSKYSTHATPIRAPPPPPQTYGAPRSSYHTQQQLDQHAYIRPPHHQQHEQAVYTHRRGAHSDSRLFLGTPPIAPQHQHQHRTSAYTTNSSHHAASLSLDGAGSFGLAAARTSPSYRISRSPDVQQQQAAFSPIFAESAWSRTASSSQPPYSHHHRGSSLSREASTSSSSGSDWRSSSRASSSLATASVHTIGSATYEQQHSPGAPLEARKEAYGLRRAEQISEKNIVDLDLIAAGLETRRTLMVKNIPNKMTSQQLVDYLDTIVPSSYDFVYLRIDFASGCCVGYAFVNFTSSQALFDFCKSAIGTRWNIHGSDKIVCASFANIQGKAALVEKFRNSSVLDEKPEFRPRLFYTDGPLRGEPQPWPAPDNLLRKARSTANKTSIGLFQPTTKPIFVISPCKQPSD